MKRFKLVRSIFICTTLFSTTTFAHAIIMKDGALPVTTAALHNWTGYYAGINLGAVNHTMNISDTQAIYFNASIEQVSSPQMTGGFQVGYRRQLDPTQVSGVYGLEFSGNFSNTTFNKEYGSPSANYLLSSNNQLKEVGLLQLTGGIAADKILLFLAGGMSWTNITGSTTSQNGAPFFNSFNVNNKSLGVALGGGVEYAINEKISARIKVDVVTPIPNTYTAYDSGGNAFQISNSIVQGTFGINYKFA